jgi:hypothetical protein
MYGIHYHNPFSHNQFLPDAFHILSYVFHKADSFKILKIICMGLLARNS